MEAFNVPTAAAIFRQERFPSGRPIHCYASAYRLRRYQSGMFTTIGARSKSPSSPNNAALTKVVPPVDARP